MERISRYILVVVAIITCSMVLPKVYWMAFEKPIRAPFVLYSCVDNDFIVFDGAAGKRFDTKGNTFTREEYETKLPMMYARQLMISGIMPDTINGVAIDVHEMNRARSTFRFQPEEINGPQIKLFPLFESESGRANIEMPEDYFRISWRMEFIDAKTNKVNEEKSRTFSAALYQKGFAFPAKRITGLPTTRKSCDEGYLIIDSANQLFHLKMMEGIPYVQQVSLPEGLRFKYISCVDFKDKKFYAYLFSETNEIYILTQDDYQLVKLPIDGFDASNCEMKIMGDMFHYSVIIEAENSVKAIALNYSDYQKVDEYRQTWLKRSERKEGRIFASLFPFQLSMTNEYSSFNRFYFDFSAGFIWVLVNLLFVGLHVGLLIRRKAKMHKHIIDLLLVAFTGVFGFIAIYFFPNKFFD